MKLYPPQLEGTLPAFYKTSEKSTILSIPFSMNRAVSAAEVYGYSLRVKDVINSDELFTVNTTNHSSTSEAIFLLNDMQSEFLVVGSYYKFQLAYIDKDGNTGYYSTVGVVKCTSQPTVIIEGLELSLNNNHKYFYTGFYQNGNDPTEKVYSYQFILTDKNGEVISDSGKRIHLIENNTDVTYESIDTYTIPFDLEDDNVYFLQYIITTNNGLIVKSPKYRILQTSLIEMLENLKLETSLNFDEGYINIDVIYDEDNDSMYILDTSSEFLNFTDYYEKIYNIVKLDSNTYIPNVYYILNNGEYILAESLTFDVMETYYESSYHLIKLTNLTYQTGKYYIKQEHFVKGNFLISRSSRDTNYKEWYQVCEIHIDGFGKVFYSTKDFTIEQGKYYKYSIQEYNSYGTLSQRKITDEIFADFEDMFLYDGKRQLKVRYNPKISSFKINKIINKVDTIGGKYPYIFENSATYYHEFPISGLISYLMDNNELFMTVDNLGLSETYNTLSRSSTFEQESLKQQILNNVQEINLNNKTISDWEMGFITITTQEINEIRAKVQNLIERNKNLKEILNKKYQKEKLFDEENHATTNLISTNMAAERIFKTEVLDWLNDGEPKLFRSPGEGNFLIVLTNVSLAPEDKLSRMLHTFSATAYEIADFNYDNLSNLKISNIGNINQQFITWKTINLSEEVGFNKMDDNYFTDESNRIVVIYRGDIQYNYAELLGDTVAYSFYLTGLKPNTIIYLDGEEILVGATGSYYYESENGVSSLLVPENTIYTGTLTYSYYGSQPSAFDTVLSSKVMTYGGSQFIGENKDIVSQINCSAISIRDFGYLQFMMRDIVEVELADNEDWDNLFYKDEAQVIFLDDENTIINTQDNIYYYEVPDRLDFGLKEIGYNDDLELNTIYYKNNRQGLNPLYTDNLENKELYSCIYREGFFIPGTDQKINIYNNYYPLYKYDSDRFIFNNEIQLLENHLRLYKDVYRNKYYIDEETAQELEEEELNVLLNDYNFEILNFEVIFNENVFSVGPIYNHIKKGRPFKKYEQVFIDSEEEFNSYENLYILINNEYVLASSFDLEENYYQFQDYRNFTFYTTYDCSNQIINNITEENCENYYILDEIEVIPDYNVEHVRIFKDLYTFNNLTIGNGVVLNCSYQTNNTTYSFENISNVDNKYSDIKLQDIITQMNYYWQILNGNFSENTLDFSSIALTDLDGIVEYYKQSLLDKVMLVYDDEENSYEESQSVIEKYIKFLNVYNMYTSGEINDLTDFKEALGDNGELLRTINSLIEEKIIIQEHARKEYLKYQNLYYERIEQLLAIYNEEV